MDGHLVQTRERMCRFSVALPSSVDAVVAPKAEHPDIEVVAKHMVSVTTLNDLGMTHGDITEWIPLACKEKIIEINGQPTD